MAAPVRIDQQLQKDRNFFSVSANNFMVGGPLGDGAIQLIFAEDFGETTSMTIVGDVLPGGGEGVYTNTTVEFESSGVRVMYGRVKMTLTAAKQLSDLLAEHVQSAEETMRQAAAAGAAFAAR